VSYLHPVFLARSLRPSDVSGLEVSLVEVEGRRTQPNGGAPPEKVRVTLEARLAAEREEALLVEIAAQAVAEQRATITGRFHVTVHLAAPIDRGLAGRPRSLALVKEMAWPAIDAALSELTAALLMGRKVMKPTRVSEARRALRARAQRAGGQSR